MRLLGAPLARAAPPACSSRELGVSVGFPRVAPAHLPDLASGLRVSPRLLGLTIGSERAVSQQLPVDKIHASVNSPLPPNLFLELLLQTGRRGVGPRDGSWWSVWLRAGLNQGSGCPTEHQHHAHSGSLLAPVFLPVATSPPCQGAAFWQSGSLRGRVGESPRP